MSEPTRDNSPGYEASLPYAVRGADGDIQTGTMDWVVRRGPATGTANGANEAPAEHDDVKPDLLIDPPDPAPEA